MSMVWILGLLVGWLVLAAALDLLQDGYFNREDPSVHRDVVRYLRHEDPYLVCEDFASYLATQSQVDAAYGDAPRWLTSVAANIAASGKFSSDRSIQDYARDIWKLAPHPVRLS